MTHQPPSPSASHRPHMPESSIGRVLQRGGSELLLEKLADRVSIGTSDVAALHQVVEGLPAEVSSTKIPGNVTELLVEPTQRDPVMQELRSANPVDYASHVYRLSGHPNSRVYLTNEITIQFAPAVRSAEMTHLAAQFGLEMVKPLPPVPNAFVFKVLPTATENPVKIANRLIQRSEVMVAEPNVVMPTQAFYQPKDPLYPQQWHLNHRGGNSLVSYSHIFAEPAWDITRGNRSIVVAVMDDSVDVNHPDFQGPGKIVAPRDFKGNDFLPLPEEIDDNHGTACAGVAVAEENGKGGVGVAPGCALMPLRTTGYLDDEGMEDLFGWAVENGAAVISCSWGPAANEFPLSLRMSAALSNAATRGRQGKGCVIVFAAGNSNRPLNATVTEKGWPGNQLEGPTRWLNGFAVHPDVIAVAASTSLSKKAAYSNWGAEISVCAPSNNAPPMVPPAVSGNFPGLGIVTTDRPGAAGYSWNDSTSDFGGTSSACPVVAGVAALILAANPDLTASEVRQILQQTADKITDSQPDSQFGLRRGTYETGGRSDWFGYGKVNAFKAVQAATQRKTSAVAGSRQLVQQNANRQAIPDYDLRGMVSAMQISDASLVRDIRVLVDIEHPFLGDLTVSLITPKGQTIVLQGRTLGSQTRLQTTYSLQTTPLLKQVLNQPAQGQWQLKVVDGAVLDTGTLNRWQISFSV